MRAPPSIPTNYSYTIWINFTGKSSANSKAKNSKPGQEVKDTTKPKTKIPRMSELFGEDSDEDDLGQGQEKPRSNAWKFSNTSSSKVHSLISKDLLPVEMSSLCHDLENLVLYSSSESTWNNCRCEYYKYYDKVVMMNLTALYNLTVRWCIKLKELSSLKEGI